MKFPRLLFPLIALAIFSTASLVVIRAAPPGAGWVPVAELTDEFNGSSLNTNKWAQPNWPGTKSDSPWGAFKPANAYLSGGNLVLKLKKETTNGLPYSMGGILGKTPVRHGYIEARYRTAVASGTLSALWLYRNYPKQPIGDVVHREIDVNDAVYGDRKMRAVWIYHVRGNPVESAGTQHDVGNDPTQNYNIYGLQWTPHDLKWYLNNNQVRTFAHGGRYNADLDLCLDLNTNQVNSPTVNEAFMYVDWVRVYQRTGNHLANPGFESGALGSWTATGGGATVVSANQRGGSHAVRINTSSSGATQTITGLTPNKTYVLKGWLKNANVGDRVYLGVKNHGSPEINASTTTTGYTQLTVTFTTGSGASGAKADVYLWKNASAGASFADDLTLLPQ
jgi:hypothetical protein